MAAFAPESLALRLYRRAVGRLPLDLRRQHGDEMVRALASLLAAERERRGRLGVVVLWMRAMLDLGATGRRLKSATGAASGWRGGLRGDLRSAIRQLRSRPGHAAAAVVSIALSVGAVTAVFALADPMLFRPLPYPDAERLVDVIIDGDGTLGYANLPDLLAAADHPAFGGATDFGLSEAGGYLDGTTTRLTAYEVTDGFFRTLQVVPGLGRAFGPGDYEAGARPVAIISHQVWQQAFGGRADILGQVLRFELPQQAVYELVGVMPADFVLPDTVNRPPDFLVPWVIDRGKLGDPSSRVGILARPAPGVSTAQATAAMQAILTQVEREHPTLAQGRTASVRSLRQALFGYTKPTLLALLVATASVLLLAAVNLTHLSLSRLLARGRELATRAALGASPARLTRQVLVESSVLALLGGVAALVVAHGLVDLVLALAPERAHVYRLLDARVDGRVIGVSLGLVLLVLAGFGLLPALRARTADLRTGVGGSLRSRTMFRQDAVIVLAQTAAVVAILVFGGLITRSFARAAFTPLGFDPSGVQAVEMVWPREYYGQDGFFDAQRAVVDGLRPIVRGPVAVSEGMPGMTLPFFVTGAGQPRGERSRVIGYPVNNAFFDVFRLTLLRGRLFTEDEAFADAPVAVLDARAAQALFSDRDALGRALTDGRRRQWQVVGIVAGLATSPLRGSPSSTAFVPLRHDSGRDWWIRYREPGGPTLEAAQRVVQVVEPRALVTLEPAVDPISVQLAQPRFLATLLGTLAALALLLAAVGLTGVVSHAVGRRRREIGIRRALGADLTAITRLVVTRSIRPAAVGVLIGLAGAWWASGLLSNQLHGIEPGDPATYLSAGLAVMVVAIVAAAAPARRAARVDPREILIAE